MADSPGPVSIGSDGWALCPPLLEAIHCRECGRDASAQRHSPMALTGCCYEHVPAAPGDLVCPATCFAFESSPSLECSGA